MAQELQFTNDGNGNLQKAQGSDNRLNVSARIGTRAYYNSREKSRAFSLIWNDASTATGDHIAYWKNDDTNNRLLVISCIKINSEYRADFQVEIVSGTAAGGAAAVPSCLNRDDVKIAAATTVTAVTTAVTGLTTDVTLDTVSVKAGDQALSGLGETIRLGQGDAIAIYCLLSDTSPGRTSGTIVGYYE